eukprot:4131622-Pleurochrysis_carterae.AAC.1
MQRWLQPRGDGGVRVRFRCSAACGRARDGLKDDCHHLSVSGFNKFWRNYVPLDFVGCQRRQT